VTIADRRHTFLEALSKHVKRIHEHLTGSAEWLQLDYAPNFDRTTPPTLKAQMGMNLPGVNDPPDDTDREHLVDLYQRALIERRSEEIARGVTVFGPHRDEMRFIAGSPALGTHEVDLGIYGSRGQQRTAVLSLKLAELRWMRDQTQENPVLLLDEVLAELDKTRRAYLLEHVDDVEQAILTATDPQMFSASFLERAETWEIKGGLVHRN
jgi:DNA replication and repair protein RecF